MSDSGLVASRFSSLCHCVRAADKIKGVSAICLPRRVERKQIPHLRVMGRNIRFLKSELEPFRAQFKQEVVNWQDQ